MSSGGYEVINKAFYAKLNKMGIEIIMDAQVEMVSRDITGRILVKTKSAGSHYFDEVISTLASDLSVQIAPSLNTEETEMHNGIKYLGVVCPSVLLKQPISKYYVTNITDNWPPFTGIIEMTALVDPKKLANHTLIYLPKYLEPGNELFQQVRC